MRYQDLKIRDVKRMILLGLAGAASVALCVFVSDRIGGRLGAKLMSWAWGIGICVPMLVAMALWYLFSSPAQNADFIRWAQKNLRQKKLAEFDWSLLDPSDPDYRTLTIRYLLRKRGRDRQ